VFSCRTQFRQEPRKAPYHEHKIQLTKTVPFKERQAATLRILSLCTAVLKMKAICSVTARDKEARRYDTWQDQSLQLMVK
jgi:hypothetical protein